MSAFWARLGPHAPRVRAAALHQPSLLQRLADAPDKTFHVYAIWLCSHDSPESETVAASLGTQSLARLLAASWGDVPRGTLAALNRCGPSVHAVGVYNQLHAILSDARLSKILQRLNEPVTAQLLSKIAGMRNVLPELDDASRFISLDAVKALDWLLRRLHRLGAAPHPDWQRNLMKNVTVNSYEKAVEALMLLHPRVPAPWRGTADIIPLETTRELHERGKAMRICLRVSEYKLRLMRGTHAFYLWRGDAPAVIQISQIAPGEWQIDQIKAADNVDVDDDALLAITAAFGAAGILAPGHIAALSDAYLA